MPPEESKKERVAILGASDKPDRYSNKALHLLREHGHEDIPVHPAIPEIEGKKQPSCNNVA